MLSEKNMPVELLPRNSLIWFYVKTIPPPKKTHPYCILLRDAHCFHSTFLWWGESDCYENSLDKTFKTEHTEYKEKIFVLFNFENQKVSINYGGKTGKNKSFNFSIIHGEPG